MDQLFAPWRMEWVTRDRCSTDGCVFCNIAEEQCDRENRVVARSDHALVLLNRSPYNPGHTLIIPNDHGQDYTDLDNTTLVDLHRVQQEAMTVVSDLYYPDGFNVGMNLGSAGGASITDHIHLHIVPRWEGDTNFMPVLSETAIMEESLNKTYERLHSAFGELEGAVTQGLDTAVYLRI